MMAKNAKLPRARLGARLCQEFQQLLWPVSNAIGKIVAGLTGLAAGLGSDTPAAHVV